MTTAGSESKTKKRYLERHFPEPPERRARPCLPWQDRTTVTSVGVVFHQRHAASLSRQVPRFSVHFGLIRSVACRGVDVGYEGIAEGTNDGIGGFGRIIHNHELAQHHCDLD